MRRAAAIYCIVVLGMLFLPQYSYGASEADIRSTIGDMVDLLYKSRNKDGIWDNPEGRGHSHGGKTSIAVLALLSAGESYQNPKLVPAIKWLKKIDMTGDLPNFIEIACLGEAA